MERDEEDDGVACEPDGDEEDGYETEGGEAYVVRRMMLAPKCINDN